MACTRVGRTRIIHAVYTYICVRYSLNVRIKHKQLGVDNWRLLFSVELIVELFASLSATICVRPTRLKAITSVSATFVNVPIDALT